MACDVPITNCAIKKFKKTTSDLIMAGASVVEKDFNEFKEKSWAELCEDDDSNDTVKNTTADDEDSKLVINEKEDGEVQNENEVNFRTYSSLFKGNADTTENKDTKENPQSIDSKTPTKKLPIAHDDLSLTSHLDTFHMASPLKLKSNLDPIMDDETKVSPFKNKRKHTGSYSSETNMDESPSKMTRSSDRQRRRPDQHTPYAKFKNDGSRKRQRDDNIESPGTPGSGKKLAYETDPAILLRRQKQIDFGKNTVGYDRYCSMVKREDRTKDHPKTPPKELKYSRRAWDGLIKSWRSRLHFWDPPNENGEPNSLLLDEDDDISSLDSQSVDSLPCTPIQEWKRRVRAKRESLSEDEEEDCKPLQD
ncbi:hypothetical protein M8J75_002572 [Diaphorina citri]|nr:hypothetical protein M8J75_002572 [Diaphorina citri]